MKNTNDIVKKAYFEWLYKFITHGRFAKEISYRQLLMRLHEVPFRYSIEKDSGRADDGIDLRYRFAKTYKKVDHAERYIDTPCSILEMILALAIRCEETIMDDPRYGDRTGQWFWGMITNLGLGSMVDDIFDSDYVDDVIETFLNRNYGPDGTGGLFTVRNCDCDLRTVEIWYQLCYFLDTII